jgi:hypothetical protein
VLRQDQDATSPWHVHSGPLSYAEAYLDEQRALLLNLYMGSANTDPTVYNCDGFLCVIVGMLIATVGPALGCTQGQAPSRPVVTLWSRLGSITTWGMTTLRLLKWGGYTYGTDPLVHLLAHHTSDDLAHTSSRLFERRTLLPARSSLKLSKANK